MNVLFAMGLLVCFSFCGLCLDLGRMELLKVQMQSAADAAAIGAELESERIHQNTTWDWPQHGQQDAAVNGFTNGQNNTTVSVKQAPDYGEYIGRYDAIQVTITRTMKTIFMGALNKGTYTLTAKAVALVPPCNYFLGNSSVASNTFYNASAGMPATCPVYVNYNYTVDGFARLWGFGIDVSGPAAVSSPQGWVSQEPDLTWPQPQILPNYNLPVIIDPLSNIAQPVFSSCSTTSYKLLAGTVTINPGTYCGTSGTPGLTVTNATLYLNPGLYIITGGVNFNNSTINGTGVTLFFTKGNGAGYGQAIFGSGTGNSIINLSAPVDISNSGITGILFFADRNWVQTSSMDFSFNTNGSFNGDGIWYLPNTGLYIWQNSNFSMPNYGSFVVRNTYFFGTNVNSTQDFSTISGGSPFRSQAVLVQ